MAVDTQNKDNDVRFRTVTMSLRADRCTEDIIKKGLDKWKKGIKGSAYILHDKDRYTEKEVKEINHMVDDSLEEMADNKDDTTRFPDAQAYADAVAKVQMTRVKVGDKKPDHWHILLDFGTNAKAVSAIAELFQTEPSMIQSVRGKKKGFANMLAYLTHITEQAQLDGKHEYRADEVKGLKFPDSDAYAAFQTYEDFANAFIDGTLTLDMSVRMVLEGKITPYELQKKDPDFFITNEIKIYRARARYIENLPTPDILFNFFVGAMDTVKEGGRGRIGKSLACQVLALSHLKSMYPKVDFDNMSKDDLQKKGYIYWAGGEGVSLQNYDGQPIIIWEDVRGYDLIKTFGGVGRLFGALDTHPKPVAFNIKYGHTYLKNRINIFNGIQTYSEFINELSVEWVEQSNSYGDVHTQRRTKEDKSQAKGRFPFFIEVAPSMITVNAQLEYLIGSSEYNFKHSCRNDLAILAQAGRLGLACKALSEKYEAIETNIGTGALVQQSVPDDVMRELSATEVLDCMEKDGVTISDEVLNDASAILHQEYSDFVRLWKQVFSEEIASGKKSANEYADYDTWILYGRCNAYDAATGFYRKG